MGDKTNYSVDSIKKKIKEEQGWGSYFIVDDYLEQTLFDNLCDDLEKSKKENIYTIEEKPRIWNDTKPFGMNLCVGGAGGGIKYFDKLNSLSFTWKEFINSMYSKEMYNYFLDIFSDTKVFKDNVTEMDIKDSSLSCKLSSQLDNYGDIIHPDATQKVVSFLLYLDNKGWNENSIGGTDFWKVTNKKVDYDTNPNSIDYKYRGGRFSSKHSNVRLTVDEAEKIIKFKSINFKPNRLVGFVRNNKSYHSIPPRVLPNGVTRDCFQINIWNLRSRVK